MSNKNKGQMKANNKLEKAVKKVLDLYFHQGVQIPMGVVVAKREFNLTIAEAVALKEEVKNRI